MLIFSRNVKEKFMIGNDIKIEILRVDKDGRVFLGIQIPEEIRVGRAEKRFLTRHLFAKSPNDVNQE